MLLFIPEHAKITLSKRRTQLCLDKSWAEQGQIFYSGKVKYGLELPKLASGEYVLNIPKARDCVTVYVDGKKKGKSIKAPYEFNFKVENETPKIQIEVINSYANAIEGYAEESGILSGVEIYAKR